MSASEITHQQEDVSDLVLYADEIEYFETHDLSEELANGPEVHFEISPQARRSRFYFEVELGTASAQLESHCTTARYSCRSFAERMGAGER